MIDKIADQVVRRNLETPALLTLEMHKPLAGILGQSAIVFSPFLAPYLGIENVHDYSRLFSKRSYWDALIVAIESKNREKREEETPKERSA